MKGLLKASDVIDRFCGWAVISLFTLMTVTYAAQVILRYVFSTGLMWTEELTRYADIWAIMIGAAMIASGVATSTSAYSRKCSGEEKKAGFWSCSNSYP